MKKILTAIFALAATFALVSCGNKKNVVHIGYYTGDLCNAPMHIAMEKGFFEEEFKKAGVEFDYISRVQANANTGELIASGKMDAGTDLAAAILPSMENGLKITYVLGFHTGCTKFYVRQDSGINSVEDLKGKKVAIPGLQDTAYMNLRRKLESVGIKTSQEDGEVEFIVYDQTSIPIALDKGNVDVIGIHDPVATLVEKQYGFKKIFDIGTDPDFEKEYCCQAFVSQKLVKENPEGAKAFARALLKASAYVQEEPYETAKLQLEKNWTTGDAQENGEILSLLNYVPSIRGGKATVGKQARDLQKLGILRENTDIEKFIDEAFIVLPDVPDSYKYDKASGEFTPVY